MSDTFGINEFVAFSDGLIDLIVLGDSRRAIMSVAVGDNEHQTDQTDDRIRQTAGAIKPENFAAFDRLQIVTVQDILDGKRTNLPLMEEVTKRANKAKIDNQTSLFEN